MVSEASNHTILINKIIAMLTFNKKWPCPLFNMGHKLECIEEKFNVGTQGPKLCNPDVMCSNPSQNNILLFECKGGKNIEKKQLETYLLVSPTDVNGLVTVKDSEKLTVFFTYTGSNATSLKKSISETLSIIEKEGKIKNIPKELDLFELTDNLVKIHSSSNFNWDASLVQGISISPWTFPMNFYPFSNEDNPEYILSQTIRSILHLISKKNPINPGEVVLTPDEVTQDIFSAIYAYIPSSKKRDLLKLVDGCFKALLKERKIKNRIYRLGIRGTKISFRITEGIMEDLQDLIIAIEEGQEQTDIEDYL